MLSFTGDLKLPGFALELFLELFQSWKLSIGMDRLAQRVPGTGEALMLFLINTSVGQREKLVREL